MQTAERAVPATVTTRCKICDSPAETFGSKVILGKYNATYLRCGACGYTWVDAPHWLDEAYSQAIAALDTGIVVRNLWLADVCSALFGSSLRHVNKLLDYGGGSGLLVRLLRDRGYDAWWMDSYCQNILAGGFEAQANDTFDLVTAFELVEHLPNPLPVFKQLRTFAPRVLIGTELQPADPSQLMQWHYLAPEAGQHIGFFTRRSLEVVAEQLGLRLSSNGTTLHLLAEERISERWLRMLDKRKTARFWARLGKRRALTYTDADAMLARLRSKPPL